MTENAKCIDLQAKFNQCRGDQIAYTIDHQSREN